MMRYIKAADRWIDTLEEQKNGKCYYIIDGDVWYYSYESGQDYIVGKLQDEKERSENEL